MEPDIKNRLKTNIAEVCAEFNMGEILMNSFSLQYDGRIQLSATDMAYAVTSLLESPSAGNIGEGNSENTDPNISTASSGVAGFKQNPSASVSDVHQKLYDNFKDAYESLDLKRQGVNLLRKGIQMAKEMQEAIVRVGNDLIEKKVVKSHTNFRYVILENSYLKDTKLFQYPLALQKLAHFIMQDLKVSNCTPLDFQSHLS